MTLGTVKTTVAKRHQFMWVEHPPLRSRLTMTNRNVTKPEQTPDPAGDERQTASPMVQQLHESSDSIDGAELLRILEGDQHLQRHPDDTAQTPQIMRMPEGFEVVEQRVGLAAGQWVLRVRCQCGRSWFEVEAVHWATCPRCSQLVRVNIDATSYPK